MGRGRGRRARRLAPAAHVAQLATAGAAVVLLSSCGTMTPAASVTPAGSPTSQSPSPAPALSGALVLTGAVDARFAYTAPLNCVVSAKRLSLTMKASASAQFAFQFPVDASAGTYAVDPTVANGPDAVYQGPQGVFNARSGTITVTSVTGTLYTGSIDVSLTSLASKTAHASGTWACRRP